MVIALIAGLLCGCLFLLVMIYVQVFKAVSELKGIYNRLVDLIKKG